MADNFESFSEVLISAEKIDKMLSLDPLVKDRENINMNPDTLKGEIEFKDLNQMCGEYINLYDKLTD